MLDGDSGVLDGDSGVLSAKGCGNRSKRHYVSHFFLGMYPPMFGTLSSPWGNNLFALPPKAYVEH